MGACTSGVSENTLRNCWCVGLFENTSNRTFEKDDCASDIPHCVRSGLSKWPPVLRTCFQSQFEHDIRNKRLCFGHVFGNAVRHELPKWAHVLHTHFKHVEPGTGTFEMGACGSDVFGNTLRNCWCVGLLFENTANRTFEKDDCASDIPHCVRS